MQAELTAAGSVMGTVSHMSPEQIRGEPLDRRTDLFSLGVVLYEMATGALPFSGPHPPVVFDCILNREPTPPRDLNPSLPSGIQRIIQRCLEKDRERRYKHASEIRADLQGLSRGAGPGAGTLSGWSRRRILTGITTLAVAACAAGYLYLHRAPKSIGKVTLTVAELRNTTGDPALDSTIRPELLAQLQEPPFQVIPDGNVRRVLGLMRQPANAQLTANLAREICERTGSAAVVEGSVDVLSSKLVVGLTAKNCRTGAVLFAEQLQSGRKEDTAATLGRIAARFRARTAESLAAIQRNSTSLAEVTTTSLEALRVYTAARDAVSTKDRTAQHLFQHAVEIDPEFASAYSFLGSMDISLGDKPLGRQRIAKAWSLRDTVSDQERFFVDLNYELRVLENLIKARQTCELWIQSYPRDSMPHSLLSGTLSLGVGKFDRAEQEGKLAIELDPDAGYGYHNLANSYIVRNRPGDAESVIKRAEQRKLHLHEFFALRLQAAFLKGDRQQLDQAAAASEAGVGTERWLLDMWGDMLAYYGHLRKAREKWQQAVDVAVGTQRPDQAAQHEAGIAVREFLFGNTAEARVALTSALRHYAQDRDAETGTALALAFLGDPRAEALVNDLDRRFPGGTFVQFAHLPFLRAQLALNRHDPAAAIKLLDPAAAYELGWESSATSGFSGSLFVIYLRGQAHLAAHRPAEAAAEFRKLIDNMGVVSSDPTIVVAARLQLARALVMSGDRRKAKAIYEGFLDLWKEADPDIPILNQAKKEYNQMQSSAGSSRTDHVVQPDAA